MMSPSGGSTLMTSAPRSPRIWVASGPRTTLVRSTTVTPASGPSLALLTAAPRQSPRVPKAARRAAGRDMAEDHLEPGAKIAADEPPVARALMRRRRIGGQVADMFDQAGLRHRFCSGHRSTLCR